MTQLEDVIELMACPKCKENVVFGENQKSILCRNCGLKYPVQNGGIPEMVIENAENIHSE